MLKLSRKKMLLSSIEKRHCLQKLKIGFMTDFPKQVIKDKSNGMPFLNRWEEKSQLPTKILYPVKIFFKNEGELKTFSAPL